MHFLLGLGIIASIIYFAFVQNDDDTTEQAIKKIARIVIILIMSLVALLYIYG